MSAVTSAGPDGRLRCRWCLATPGYRHYHDTEWGFPVADDRRLFEKLCLEGFQAGLSWRTVLEKRESFREAFAQFEPEWLASFTEEDVTHLLHNPGIIRHRGKIEAAINNARRALELIEAEGSLAAFLWRYEPQQDPAMEPASRTMCAESHALSRELKKRGWRFVGPTTLYSFMQAMGMVNDHARDCHVRALVAEARARFDKPA
ncbi:MAG TPA: DNA-3-methyladenine glycosylase I [Burkholderiaceae bacterium]|nr:DNA-3-methyladenine glycosylase I [Burkholderiaceae bacterium]